jgi:hypothetical protein
LRGRRGRDYGPGTIEIVAPPLEPGIGEIWVLGIVVEPCLRGYAVLITTDEATVRMISDLMTDWLEQGLAARARLALIGVRSRAGRRDRVPSDGPRRSATGRRPRA